MSAPPRLPPLATIERLVGAPIAAWEGQCYALACAFVDHEIVPDAIAVYGHWTGPIAPTSTFGSHGRLGFVHHGWVLAGEWIVDPTRWAFAMPPVRSVFVGRCADHPEYDEGGNGLRGRRLRPPPRWDAAAKPAPAFDAGLSPAARAHVVAMLGDARPMTVPQQFWLANAAYSELEPHAAAIYAWFERVGAAAFVPIDNHRRAARSRHGETPTRKGTRP